MLGVRVVQPEARLQLGDPHPHRGRLGLDDVQALLLTGVAIDEKRASFPFRLDLLLQLPRAGRARAGCRDLSRTFGSRAHSRGGTIALPSGPVVSRAAMRIGVRNETAPGERRVALVPASVETLIGAEHAVAVGVRAGGHMSS